MFEHANGVAELHYAVAIEVRCQCLVGRQSVTCAVDVQTHHHFENGNCVLQVHSAAGGVGLGGGNRAACRHRQARFGCLLPRGGAIRRSELGQRPGGQGHAAQQGVGLPAIGQNIDRHRAVHKQCAAKCAHGRAYVTQYVRLAHPNRIGTIAAIGQGQAAAAAGQPMGAAIEAVRPTPAAGQLAYRQGAHAADGAARLGLLHGGKRNRAQRHARRTQRYLRHAVDGGHAGHHLTKHRVPWDCGTGVIQGRVVG